MRYVGTAAACGLLASSSVANAIDFSMPELPTHFHGGSVGWTSDYVWAGYTNSAGKPSRQVIFDWETKAGTGLYFELTAEDNIKYYEDSESKFTTTANMGGGNTITIDSNDKVHEEVDFYLGYWGYIGGGYHTPYDVGIGYYYYPGARKDITYEDADKHNRLYTTGSYADFYAGIGHYFFDNRVKIMAYQTFTNDYNAQNEIGASTYADAEIYMPYGLTLTLHGGYNYGSYWKNNLWGFSAANTSHYSLGWCGYTWGLQNKTPGSADLGAQAGRSASCKDARGSDSDYWDWGIGLKRSFGDFDVSVQEIWATGIEHEEMVKKWWSGWDEDGANQIYTEPHTVVTAKYSF